MKRLLFTYLFFLTASISFGQFSLEGETQTIQEDKRIIDNLLDKDILETTGIKHLERLSLQNLYKAIKTRKQNDLSSLDYELAFWAKIMQPIIILILAFIAVPFVFGPLRSSSIGLKILTGAIVGFSFHTLNTIFAPLTVVINMPPFIAAVLPSIIFLCFGMFMMNRVKN